MSAGLVSEIWRYPVKSMAGERLERCDVGLNGLRGDRGWAVRDSGTGEIHNAKRFPVLMQCAALYVSPPTGDDIPDVQITLPDGETISSGSPALSARLSQLMGHPVSLEKVRPASDTDFYRRRDPGAGLMGRVARFRQGRRVLAWGVRHGLGGDTVREDFARLPDEPLPDLRDIPPEAFEFYTPPGTFFDVLPIHVLTTAALSFMRRLNPNADWDVRRFRPNVLVDTADSPADHLERQWVGRLVRIGGVTIKGEMATVRCAMPMHPQADLARDPSILRTIVREADQCLGLYASVNAAGAIATGDAVEAE